MLMSSLAHAVVFKNRMRPPKINFAHLAPLYLLFWSVERPGWQSHFCREDTEGMGAAEVATWMPSCFSLSAAKARSFCNLLDGHSKRQSFLHTEMFVCVWLFCKKISSALISTYHGPRA